MMNFTLLTAWFLNAIAALYDQSNHVPANHRLTADWTEDDVSAELDFCDAEGITNPAVPIEVWAVESDNLSTSHNVHGDASGILQLMPSTAFALGWPDVDTNLDAFRELTVAEQMTWAARFYEYNRNRIGTVRDFYLCTFLPYDCGGDPERVIMGADGPRAGAYAANIGFDVTGRRFITSSDLTDAVERRAESPRTKELVARIELAARRRRMEATGP